MRRLKGGDMRPITMFIMYSEHVKIIGHYLWSGSTNFSKYVNVSLLYVLSNMYTIHWTTKVSPITISYIHVLGHMALCYCYGVDKIYD